MPKFKNAEEKEKYVREFKPVLISQFGDDNMTDEERNAEFEKFVKTISADTSRDKTWEENHELYEANETVKADAEYYNGGNQQYYGQWGRIAEGMLKRGDSEEAKRWNFTYSQLMKTREGQLKIVKQAAMRLLRLDLHRVKDICEGKIKPTLDDLDDAKLAFCDTDVITVLEKLTDDEMPAEERKAVIEALQDRKGLLQDYSNITSMVQVKGGALYQILPKLEFTDDEKGRKESEKVTLMLENKIAQGDRKIAEEIMAVNIVLGTGEVSTGNSVKRLKNVEANLKTSGQYEEVDLLKPEGRNYIVKSIGPQKEETMITHLEAADIAGKNQPQQLKNVLKIEKKDDHTIGLLNGFIEKELKSIPNVTDEEYSKQGAAFFEGLKQGRNKSQRKIEEENEARVIKSEYLSLYERFSDDLLEDDTAFASLKDKVEKAEETSRPSVYMDELSAAALTVIYANQNVSGKRIRKEKLETAFEALRLVKPRLAENLLKKVNGQLKDRDKITLNAPDVQLHGFFEKADYDYDKEKKNDYRLDELTQLRDHMDRHLDPWYHHNGSKFKDFRKELNSVIAMAQQKPMAKECIAEMMKRVSDAAAEYVNSHKNDPLRPLGKARLKAALVCSYICGHQSVNKDESLITSVNEQRGENRKIILTDAFEKMGVTMHKTADEHLRDMMKEVRNAKEVYTKALAGFQLNRSEKNRNVMISAAARYTAESYLMTSLKSKVTDLTDYDVLTERQALGRLENSLRDDLSFIRNADKLQLSNTPALTGGPAGDREYAANRDVLKMAGNNWIGIALDINPEIGHRIDNNRRTMNQPGKNMLV